MATKKTAIKIVKQENVLDTMAKAGVEIKLTKTEIADYISEKAQEEINEEIRKIQEEAKALRESVSKTPTGKWKTLAEAFNAATGVDRAYKLDYMKRHDTYLVTLAIDSGHGWFNGIANREIDVKDVPAPILEAEKLEERIHELNNRLRTLQTKKHRILLIEKILGGTESGKVVLGDLTKMVNKIVNG